MMRTRFFSPLIQRDAWVGTIAEFIATFLFVYLGCGSVVSSGLVFGPGLNPSRLLVIAIAHGLAIAALVSATAGVSGGHINPAVTFAFVVVRQMSVLKGAMYIIAQFAGAVLGAGLLHGTLPNVLEGDLGTHAVNHNLGNLAGVIFEGVLTFTLLFVIFGAAVDERGTGNTAPLAIGFTVLVDHLVGVPLTGASMNPARTMGPALWVGKWQGWWVYLAGPLTGATLAAATYSAIFLATHSKAAMEAPAGGSKFIDARNDKSEDMSV